MDKQIINEWRRVHGLTNINVGDALIVVDNTNQRRQDANRAQRAQACRDLKSKRNSKGK